MEYIHQLIKQDYIEAATFLLEKNNLWLMQCPINIGHCTSAVRARLLARCRHVPRLAIELWNILPDQVPRHLMVPYNEAASYYDRIKYYKGIMCNQDLLKTIITIHDHQPADLEIATYCMEHYGLNMAEHFLDGKILYDFLKMPNVILTENTIRKLIKKYDKGKRPPMLISLDKMLFKKLKVSNILNKSQLLFISK